MTKKIIFGLCLSVFLLGEAASAQNAPANMAYINTSEILDAMPDKTKAAQKLAALSNNYKNELQLMQSEYNKKYSDFITYQSSLAESIKLRRMQELTELENKIQQFMKLAQKDIEENEKILLDPLKQRINEAVNSVGIEHGFAVIYDLANPGIAFVSPGAIDANPMVKAKLGIR